MGQFFKFCAGVSLFGWFCSLLLVILHMFGAIESALWGSRGLAALLPASALFFIAGTVAEIASKLDRREALGTAAEAPAADAGATQRA